MKIFLITVLATLIAAPVIGPGSLIVGLLVLAVSCFAGAGIVGRLERPRASAVEKPAEDAAEEPAVSEETDDYLTALENDEDRWVPSRLGKEEPFTYEGERYLKVVNHKLDDFGYLNLGTGKITTQCGSGEEIAQVSATEFR